MQQETYEEHPVLAVPSSGNVYAAPAHAAKKHVAGPVGVPRARLMQVGPSISLSHVIPGCWNKSILQPVMGPVSPLHVIGTENPST